MHYNATGKGVDARKECHWSIRMHELQTSRRGNQRHPQVDYHKTRTVQQSQLDDANPNTTESMVN
jgi:hypothetical protein